MRKKILSLNQLEKKIFNLKRKKRIVLCHGVFDLLHIGHIKHFTEEKKNGDILIVTLTPDIYVNKGPDRPRFNEKLRLEAIASIGVVDYVALNIKSSAINIIEKIKPDIYCKGPDYKNHKNDITNQIKKEIVAIKKVGGKIVYTKGDTFSSSQIINEVDAENNVAKSSLKKIKNSYTFLKIRELVEKFKHVKILIIGEIIIDQYIFCEALGKSGKEPILVLREIRKEEYLGGSAAIARHLSTFSTDIKLISMVGEKKEYLSYIKKNLPKKIDFQYIKKNDSPTILKKRYIDEVNKTKVFGVDTINDKLLSGNEEKNFNKILEKQLPKYDLVIVSDYGHGLISKKSANLICKKSKYLALNTQANAANTGFHSTKNYKNINCVIINEREIRHELRDKSGKLENLMKRISREQNINDLIVTRGVEGSVFYNKTKNKFNSCEAYSKIAIDKIGAGDAMLSLISLCLSSNLSSELSLTIASLAGAHSVMTIGNKESINKNKILKSLETLLK